MNALEIHECAEELYRAHGDKSELEAAQKSRELRDAGKISQSKDWQKIRQAIAQLRGAHFS